MAEGPKSVTTFGGPPPASYVNDAHIAHTPWDFVLTFSQIAPSVPEEVGGKIAEVERNIVIRLSMSPQHTKAFLEALGNNVEKYEALYGEIPSVEPSVERVEELVRKGVIEQEVLDRLRARGEIPTAEADDPGD